MSTYANLASRLLDMVSDLNDDYGVAIDNAAPDADFPPPFTCMADGQTLDIFFLGEPSWSSEEDGMDMSIEQVRDQVVAHAKRYVGLIRLGMASVNRVM